MWSFFEIFFIVFSLYFSKKMAAILDFFIFSKIKISTLISLFYQRTKKHTMPRLRERFMSISSFFIAFSFIFTLLHWNMAAILFFWNFWKTRLFQKYKTLYKWHKEQHLSLKILFFFRQNPWICSIFPLFFTKNGGHLGFLKKNQILKFLKHVYSAKWHICKISRF